MTTALTDSLDRVLAAAPVGAELVVVRDGPTTIVAVEPEAVIVRDGTEALAALDGIGGGWWAGWLSYDLGRAVERVPDLGRPAPPIPDLVLARFDTRLVLEPGRDPRIEGTGPSAQTLRSLLDAAGDDRFHAADLSPLTWSSSMDRTAWDAAVTEILEHLRAGNCYQVNLTRRLECSIELDPVDLFRRLSWSNPAPHGALVRVGDVAVASASPERFLRRDERRVETRPIKGTAEDAETLRHSAKDRAENVMIVDLSRNDLGRVCEYGSIDVPSLFEIESHPGLHHIVSTVTGTLRPDVGYGDLIRATFPPASVTGCPKPRVLRIIEELEPVRRGIYCGAVGFIDADNDVLDLNVAIRTFTIAGGHTTFGVGGGIVADSDPGAEWEETELKAKRLLAIASGSV
jgi:para-aminobenzoate synthetase component 1